MWFGRVNERPGYEASAINECVHNYIAVSFVGSFRRNASSLCVSLYSGRFTRLNPRVVTFLAAKAKPAQMWIVVSQNFHPAKIPAILVHKS